MTSFSSLKIFTSSEKAVLREYDKELANQDNPEFTQSDIRHLTGLSMVQVQSGIHALWKKGLLRRKSPPRSKKRPIRWMLSSIGKLSLTALDAAEKALK